MKVLLIEDEQRVAAFIRKGLEEHGIRVALAYDGVTGLNMATSDQYDVDAKLVPGQKDQDIDSVADFIRLNKVDLLCTIKRNKSFLGRFLGKNDTGQLPHNVEVPVLVINE